MKALLVALLAFAAPSAYALECYSDELVIGDGKYYVTAPALIIDKEDSKYARFISPSYREANFASNLCRLCGYGDKATAISYEVLSPGPVYAVLDSSGQLSRVGKIDAYSNAVDSLTCEH